MSQNESGDRARVVDAFTRYQDTGAGRLRYRLARHNLTEMHPVARGARILDAGGGDGKNTAFYLAQGHWVTLLDANEKMLEKLQTQLKGDSAEHCRLVQGKIQEAPSLLPGEQFDLIVCHHVLEYVDDIQGALRALRGVAAPGGALSVITLNPVSEVLRAVVFSHDPTLALQRLTNFAYDAKWFGNATLFPISAISAAATASGWRQLAFRGMRILADYVPEKEWTEEVEESLFQLEASLASLDPYRHIGRYAQFAFDAA